MGVASGGDQGRPVPLTPELSKEIAEARGAGRFISGILLAEEDSIGVTVRLHDVDGDDVMGRETAWGSDGETFNRIGLAAIELLLPQMLDPGQAIDLTPLTNRETGAVALAIQGDRAYRESRYGDAVEFYRRALDEDSLLAIAATRGATAGVWEEEHEEALALADHAVRHLESLSPRYQRFVQGVQGYLLGDFESATGNLEAALQLEPDWPEASTVLAEAYYHLLPSHVEPVSRAEAIFEDLAEQNPTFAPPLLHLTEIALRSDQLGKARELIDRLADVTGPDARNVIRLTRMVECVESDGADADRWNAIAEDDPGSVMAAGMALAAGGAQPLCAEQAFQAARTLGGAWTWGSLLALQSLWLAQGRIQETLDLLDETLNTGYGPVYNLYMFDAGISHAFDPGARRSEEVARNALGDLYRGASGVNLWLLGVWFASEGEAERSEALARELETFFSTDRDREARMLSAALDAHTALAEGDRETAIRRLSELSPTAPLWKYFWEFHEALAPERIRLARALLDRGDYQEALRVASLFDHPAPVTYLAYLAPSLAIRLRAAEALGRSDLVVEYRQRLVRLGWANGDVPLSMTGPLLLTSSEKESS